MLLSDNNTLFLYKAAHSSEFSLKKGRLQVSGELFQTLHPQGGSRGLVSSEQQCQTTTWSSPLPGTSLSLRQTRSRMEGWRLSGSSSLRGCYRRNQQKEPKKLHLYEKRSPRSRR